jgi:glycosyltransferase involved in cell wall biosynthesis
MRVVFLTTEFPWPATSGGSVRTVSQLRILASLPEVERITLLSVAERPVRLADQDGLRAAIPKVEVVPPLFHPIHLFDFKPYVPRVVALRALGVPYLAGKWDCRDLRRTLKQLWADRANDVMYIDHLGMTRYLPDIQAVRRDGRIVLDQHNVESDFFKQFAEKRRGASKIVANAEYRLSVRFEKKALQNVNSVVAISAEDAKHFDKLAGITAHVVPMVLPFERRERPRPAGGVTLCYVGNLRWRPNVAGLDWFCRDVWPRVRARLPEAKFEIAGVGLDTDSRGAPVVPAAWKREGVTTLGFVDNLEPLYARALAMLAPVFGGSGVRVKMLEGFRAGMPVVTTPDGAFGLPLEDGVQALIAGDVAGFAERVCKVASDEVLRQRVREGGYAYLEQHHSQQVAQVAMRRVLGIA